MTTAKPEHTRVNNQTNFQFLLSFGLVLTVFFLVSIFNIPVVTTLLRHSFDDGTYSHAYLMPAIIFYLYYILAKQGHLQFRTEISPLFGATLVLSALGLYITANAQISLGYWFMFMMVILTALANLFQFSWRTLFPASLIIFILPMWGALAPKLQDLSVIAVSFMMGFTGIPVFVDAPMVNIPEGSFEIANGCSGLRYFIVSLAISSLYIFLYISKPSRALLFFAVAIAGALLTNWIRITALILIGHHTNMTSSLMEDHNSFGWYIFIPFMILLFILGNKFADQDLTQVSQSETKATESKPSKINLVLVTLISLLSGTSLLNSFAISSSHAANIENQKTITRPDIQYYQGLTINTEHALPADSQYLIYQFDGSDLDGKPSFFNHQYIPSDWQQQQQSKVGNWQVYQVNQLGKRALVAISYQYADMVTNNSAKLKLYRLKQAFKGRQQTKLHWLFIPCQSSCNQEREMLKQI